MGTSIVPWKDIENDPTKFFTKSSIPMEKDVVIKEPSYMTSKCTNNLYHFWYTLQEKGYYPLEFVKELVKTPLLSEGKLKEKKQGSGHEGEVEKPKKAGKGKKRADRDEGRSKAAVDKKKEREDEYEDEQEGEKEETDAQSPAGSPYTPQYFIKSLCTADSYQNALELIKYGVSFILYHIKSNY